MLKTTRSERVAAFVNQVRHQLIISCQALPNEPLFGAEIMARMAIAAAQGGAKAIRANTPVDIRAIRKAVDLPIIGLYKADINGTITNDKFCLSRRAELQLSWWRRPLRAR